MEFDSKGNLYFAIGDFTVQTGEVAGYAQIDERSKKNDSQSTSANTNNLQGKINRIHPESVGTYTIPEGNLFLVCLNCHQINSKLVGPSFEDIARRYGGEDSVMTYLPKRIIGGGIGNWPGNIAMPANLSLKETEAEEITQFILGLNEFVDMPQ